MGSKSKVTGDVTGDATGDVARDATSDVARDSTRDSTGDFTADTQGTTEMHHMSMGLSKETPFGHHSESRSSMNSNSPRTMSRDTSRGTSRRDSLNTSPLISPSRSSHMESVDALLLDKKLRDSMANDHYHDASEIVSSRHSSSASHLGHRSRQHSFAESHSSTANTGDLHMNETLPEKGGSTESIINLNTQFGHSTRIHKSYRRQSPSISPSPSHHSSPGSSVISLEGSTLIDKGSIRQLPLQSSAAVSRGASILKQNKQQKSEVATFARFIMLDDGTHEHHLRNIKRQEKMGQMIKDLLGGKKLRNQAVSAIPKILSSTNLEQLDREAQEAVDAANSTAQKRDLPPTLFSSLLSQVKNGEVTPYTHKGDSLQQPNNPVSVESGSEKHSATCKPASVTTSQSFFDSYGTCQEVVGRGSFGVVRIAHKKLSKGGEKFFAVKEFKKKPGELKEEYSRRLTNEFCISSSLKHYSLIDTYDLLKDAKGDYCEVMEYCSGGDLYSLIVTAGRLEYAEADCFFKQLVRAVHYMHEMGVAHRDLKPENILLTSDGTLKVTDFGNAECFRMAWEDEVQPARGIYGSSPYIAPEEYIEKEFDPRPLDIWACGVIYIAMRTGRQLWKVARASDEFYSVYLAKRKDAKGYEPIEALKRARCRNVIYSILDPVPERRITSLQLLNSEWVREIRCCKS
ncbi:hypothetical protein FOA43_001904 [Brettanomyces nanus]|uniref:non-specific serine/threonine protein kinase n=1 Tax=Eeniella nana TaxID=13502 RepID=A0A875S0Y6_EENNA|nr:uncharacterized protein FOA43_001904 [Brettanomyces nanus]QPG74573.1 hypothetical protein FOA43_001904 [Brettanomyces nanus]